MAAGVGGGRSTGSAIAGAGVAAEVALGVDAAPPAELRRQDVSRARELAAKERAKLTREIKKLDDGLARLRADYAVNPDEYGPGEYEAARNKIRTDKAGKEKALQAVVEVEATPQQVDFVPIVVGLLDEWDTLTISERNAILRKLIRRVAVVRFDRGKGKRATSNVEIHPVWEPDPWAPKKVSLVKAPKQEQAAEEVPNLAVAA